MKRFRTSFVAVLLLAVAGCTSDGPESTQATKAQLLVDDATQTINDFVNDPDKTHFQRHIGSAKGIVIVPRLVRAGVGIGGTGGDAVVLARDASTNSWSPPAFYQIGSGTLGPQIGFETANVLMLIMTDRGMDSLLSGAFKLGIDASVAAGSAGTGVGGQTFDVRVYSRDKGAYAGATIDGSVINTRDSWNSQYYGKPTKTTDILIRRSVANPGAEALMNTVAKVAGGA